MGGGAPALVEVGEAEDALAGVEEVPRVIEGVEPNHVCAEHALGWGGGVV